jgi:catechol 2,3-dioxygenase-like lactoylglutathione lyase family enzyme
MPNFTGFSHMALTVAEVGRSKQWYSDVLGWQPLMEGTDEHGINFAFGILAGGEVGVGLRQHAGGDRGSFSPERTGMDHVSFAVGSRAELEAWADHFDNKGVTFSPIVDAPYGAVLSFKDPDGIALEAFAPLAG